MLSVPLRKEIDGILQRNNAVHAPCINCCGSIFLVDESRGDCYCRECGCIQDRVAISQHGYTQIFDEWGNARCGAPVEESRRGPGIYESVPETDAICTKRDINAAAIYKRGTYLTERLTQWQEKEPIIGEYEWTEIYDEWKRQYPAAHILSKEDVRTLLRNIDRRIIAHGGREYFVRKYLVSKLFISSSSSSLNSKHGGLCVQSLHIPYLWQTSRLMLYPLGSHNKCS